MTLQNTHNDLSLKLRSVYQYARQRVSVDQPLRLEHDQIAAEEPLQISLNWRATPNEAYQQRELTLTMRTPGDDENLVYGLLRSQRVIDSPADVIEIAPYDPDSSHFENHLEVTLRDGLLPDWSQLSRSSVCQTSCGICGVTSARALTLNVAEPLSQKSHWLLAEQVVAYPQLLRSAQPLFEQTGAVHGAGYVVADKLVAVAEDVGRHNAVDKLIGRISRESLWHPEGVLVLSGRVSFDLMQKSLIAAIPVIVAVGAPSSLAVDIARQFDQTLIGFTKQHHFNVYHGGWRLFSKPE